MSSARVCDHRDDDYLHSFPALDLNGCRALHVDGHQPDAAIHYARLCRSRGILTSLDGGGLRSNTHELLAFIDVAMVAERLCEQMQLTQQCPFQVRDGQSARRPARIQVRFETLEQVPARQRFFVVRLGSLHRTVQTTLHSV